RRFAQETGGIRDASDELDAGMMGVDARRHRAADANAKARPQMGRDLVEEPAEAEAVGFPGPRPEQGGVTAARAWDRDGHRLAAHDEREDGRARRIVEA